MPDTPTAGLRLRPVTYDDLPDVLALETCPRTNAHRPGGPPSVADVEEQLRSSLRTWSELGIGYAVVEHDGLPVGLSGLRPLELHGRSCWNLYYRFSPQVWGRGVATWAAREALRVARGREPALPVVARTRPANLPAVRVAERAGLQRRPDLDVDGFLVLVSYW